MSLIGALPSNNYLSRRRDEADNQDPVWELETGFLYCVLS